jgi:hypothetical protein
MNKSGPFAQSRRKADMCAHALSYLHERSLDIGAVLGAGLKVHDAFLSAPRFGQKRWPRCHLPSIGESPPANSHHQPRVNFSEITVHSDVGTCPRSILLASTTNGKFSGSRGPACIKNSSRQASRLSNEISTVVS